MTLIDDTHYNRMACRCGHNFPPHKCPYKICGYRDCLKACWDAMAFIEKSICRESDSFDSPPELVNQWDRDAELMCAYLSGTIEASKRFENDP